MLNKFKRRLRIMRRCSGQTISLKIGNNTYKYELNFLTKVLFILLNPLREYPTDFLKLKKPQILEAIEIEKANRAKHKRDVTLAELEEANPKFWEQCGIKKEDVKYE